MNKITEVINFEVKRVENGFTIRIEGYYETSGMKLMKYETHIAATLDEVKALLDQHFTV